MARLTADLVAAVIGDDLALKERRYVELVITMLLLKLINYTQYSKMLAPYMITAKRKELRNAALLKFEIVVGLKFALLEILRRNLKDGAERREVFKRWKVPDHSSLIEGLRKERMYLKAVKRAKTCGMVFKSPKEVQRKCGELILQIEDKITAFVNYKMSFILKSNNLQSSNLSSELQEKAVQTYYAEAPFKVEAHLNNTVIRAYRNRGQNLIKYYTAEKRSRLTNDGNGQFTSTLITLDFRQSGDNQGGENYHLYDSMSNQIAPISNSVDTKLSWDAVMARHGQHPIKNSILSLLSLQPNKFFINFVKQRYPRRIRSSYDVEDVLEKLGREEFLKSIQLFTGAREEQFYAFVNHVRLSIEG